MVDKFKLFLLTGLLFLSVQIFAQQTTIQRSPSQLYRVALELYHQKNIGEAQSFFDQYIHSSPGNHIQVEDASFYAADCAVKLKDRDALYRLTSFSNQYPTSAWIPVVNLLMGDYYFNNGRYYLALEIFNKINPKNLNKEQQGQYNYEKGFCLLKMKKSSQATPYFNNAIKSNTIYARPAQYYHSYILYENGKYEEALNGFMAVRDDPEYAKQVPVLILQTNYELGHYNKVIALGKEFLSVANFRQKPVINQLIANSLFNLKQYQSAVPYFEAYVKNTRYSVSDEDYYRMGVAQFKASDFKEAIVSFQHVTSSENKVLSQGAWYYLGSAYYQLKQYRFAQNAWVSAFGLKADPKLTAESLFSYIELTLKEKGDPYRNPADLIEKFLNDTEATANQKERASRYLVQLYINSNNKQRAISSIEQNKFPGRVLQKIYQQLTYQQAIASYQHRDFRNAMTYFEKSLRFTPDAQLRLKTLYWLANTQYWLRMYDKAIRNYKAFLLSRGAASTALYNKAYYGLGYAYFNEKKYPQAIEFFKRYLSRRKLNNEALDDAELRIADSYVMLRNYTAAISYYNRVIKGGRQDAPYALYQKAYCYGVQGKFQYKVKTLQTLINRYPASGYYANALYDMGDTYSSAINNPRQAIVYFDKLVKEKPGTSLARKALVKMGLLYYKNNQNNRAVTVLKQVISAYPASEEARVALSTLQSIYTDEGKLNEYFNYAKTLSFVQVSQSQEDSLTFSVGENAYLNGHYPKVITSLTAYLKQFPKGGFRLKSYHYLAESFAREKDTAQALNYYNKIINFPDNNYTVSALIRAARMEYAGKRYAAAYNDYHKLLSLTDNKSVKLEALDGSMQSAYLLKNYREAAQAAKDLLKTRGATEDQLIKAHFVLGKSALKLHDDKVAMTEFEITSRLSKNALGAESMYQLAQINFQSGKYKKAEKILFSLSDRFPNEVYWVAKGFILLADTYAAQGNVFQAKETLKSIIKNYPGKDLKNIARQKLALLTSKKSNNKK